MIKLKAIGDIDPSWAEGNELFIDIDSIEAHDEFNRRVERLADLIPRLKVVSVDISPSGRPGHMHIVCTCDSVETEEDRVILECALGGDPKRALLMMRDLYEHGRERVSCFFERKQ